MTTPGTILVSNRTRLLVAEDEETLARLIKTTAESIGFDVITVNDGDLVLNKVTSFNPDVILLDLIMPGLDGIEVLSSLSGRKCTARIVLMSGMGQSTLTSVHHFATTNNLDIAGVLLKPFKMSDLEELLSPLDISRGPAPSSSESSVIGDLGLQLRLEPEVVLTPSKSTEVPRAFVCLAWIKDNGEIISHAQLMDAANKHESWRGLTSLFLRELASASRQWLTDGLDLGLVVPIPDGFLQDESLPDFLAQIFRIDAVKPGTITVEFSAKALEENAITASGLLPRLKFKGVNIAISCLAQDETILKLINDFPVDEVFVDIAQSGESLSIAPSEDEFQFSSLVSIAAKRNIQTSAVNINSTNQLEFARRSGFTHARGLAVHKPLHPHEVAQFYWKKSER